jgi:hypothetical protein
MTDWKRSVIWLGLALASGCTSAPSPHHSAKWIDPSQAVQIAAASPRFGVTGVFALTVKATGKTGRVHLNSEYDYRDQRNLSIALEPRASEELERIFGAPPEVALKGKRILVSGTAKRARIVFLVDGKPTDKYYYQTHVVVTQASQIQVL